MSTNARRRSSSSGPSASSIPNTSSTSATRCCAALLRNRGARRPLRPEAEAIRTRMEELVDAAIPIIRSRVRSIDAAMEFTRLGFDDKTELLNTDRAFLQHALLAGRHEGYLRRARPVDRLHPLVRHPPLLQRFLRRTARTQPPRRAQTARGAGQAVRHLPPIQGVGRHHGRTDCRPAQRQGAGGRRLGAHQDRRSLPRERLARIADTIAAANRSQGTRMVLISGPSSSGKTTSAKRLGIQLASWG